MPVTQPDIPVNVKRKVPINLRQSGTSDARMLINGQQRKSPFWHLTQQHGVVAFSIYNHMYMPRCYTSAAEGGLLKEHEYLTKHVTLWDVSVERQIRIKGPGAFDFANFLVTRELNGKCPVNRARYVILCDEKGGIVNDPVLLRVAEDEIWLSISDSDVLLWAKGVNYTGRYEVEIDEIDVSPLQIQGPKATDLMHKLFGDAILDIRYYGLWQTKQDGMDLVISRTGFSTELGYEIYLRDAMVHADQLWSLLMQAGEEFGLRVIAPNHIRRLEGGILLYRQDMDIETNPFEVGLDWQVDLTKPEFIGKRALTEIKQRGVTRRLVGLTMGGDPITWYSPDFYVVKDAPGGDEIGYVTSAFYSPRLATNIAFAMLPVSHSTLGTSLTVALPNHADPVAASVVEVPFFDPHKHIPKG